MLKVAIVILADTITHEGFGRAVNALEAAKEFKEAGDEVQVVFDGAGTKWIGEFTKPSHKYKALFDAVRDNVSGACAYCAKAFGANDDIASAKIPLAGDYEGHPSFRKLLAQGYQVITF